MKKITAKLKGNGWAVFLLVLVLVVNLATPVFAQTTTLTTTVPDVYLLHLEIQGYGRVAVNGVIYDRSIDISVQSNTAIEITLYPKEGHYVDSVIYNSKKVATDRNNSVLLQNIAEENYLKVEFSPESSAPTTGDIKHPELLAAILWIASVGFVMVCKKRTARQSNC